MRVNVGGRDDRHTSSCAASRDAGFRAQLMNNAGWLTGLVDVGFGGVLETCGGGWRVLCGVLGMHQKERKNNQKETKKGKEEALCGT